MDHTACAMSQAASTLSLGQERPGLMDRRGTPAWSLLSWRTLDGFLMYSITGNSPPFVEDFRSELPQRVTAAQIYALVGEIFQPSEMVRINLLVVLIGKRDSCPRAATPLVDTTFYLLALKQAPSVLQLLLVTTIDKCLTTASTRAIASYGMGLNTLENMMPSLERSLNQIMLIACWIMR